VSTSQGHSLSIFRRAIERGNLTIAEATARELLRISLTDALELTILIARKDPRRHPRVAAHWLLRYLESSNAGRRRASSSSSNSRRRPISRMSRRCVSRTHGRSV
jgi:hypothetical protein